MKISDVSTTGTDTQTPCAAAPTLPPQPRRRPAWRWAFGALLAVLVLVLALLGWIIGTASGLRVAVSVGERALGGALRVGVVEGRLVDRVRVRNLSLHLPELDVQVALIDLDWRPGHLFASTLSVERLAAQGMHILTAPADQKPPEPLRLPQIHLPFAIEAERVVLEDFTLGARATPDLPQLVLSRGELSASFSQQVLELRRLDVELSVPEARLHAEGQIEPRGHYPSDLRLDWQFARPPDLALRGQGRLRGDVQQVRLNFAVSGAADLRLDAELQDLLGQPRWDAEIALAALDLPAILPGAPGIDLEARLLSSGDLDQARVTGSLRAEAPDHAEMGRVAAELDLLWADQVLRVEALNLTEDGSGALLDLHGRIDLHGTAGQVELSGVWEALRWPLTGAAQIESPRGTLDVSGVLDAFTYALEAELRGADIPETQLALRGDGDLHGTRVAELKLLTLGGEVLGKGMLSWGAELAWELALTAQDIDPGLHWPGLQGTVGLKAESRGALQRGHDYQVRADLALAGYPAAVATLSGRGDTRALAIAALGVETLGGRVDGTGRLSWSPELAWQADLNLSDLDPGVHYADWPGRLSGQIESSGHRSATGLELQARVQDIAGQLRGYPVRLAAGLTLEGERLAIETLKASSGATELNASGTAADVLAIDFSLQSPDLAELLPDARGVLRVDGHLHGASAAPRLTLNLAATDVAWQGQGVASLAGDVDVGLGRTDPIQAKLAGRDLHLAGLSFTRMSLDAGGTLASHRLGAEFDGQPLTVRLRFSGQQPEAGGYRGEFSQLHLSSADFGTWSLQRGAALAVDGARIDAGPLCLADERRSAGCARFTQSEPGAFAASLKFDRLAFASFAALLPEGLELTGHGVLDADFSGRDQRLTGKASLRIPEGEIELALAGTNERLVFSNTRAELNATADGVDAKLDVPLAGLGALDAQARLAGLSLLAPDFERQALTGSVRLALRDLSRIGALVPDVSGFSGALDADFRLGGTLAAPTLRGQGDLRNLGFRVPMIGLSVTNGNLSATSQSGERLEFNGAALVGGGRLNLSGAATQSARGLGLELRAQGDRLKVADTREYFALIGTDLTTVFGPSGLSVTGRVDVREARLMPRSIPAGTVSTSPDVVVVGEDQNAAEAGSSPLHVDVEIRLSDAVVIDAFGLHGNLRGTLRAIQEPGQQMLGDGQLEVVDGSYRLASQFGLLATLGAPLTIEQGILVFAKTPLNNPGLVLSAQREGGDMTAGVRVLGTLKKPRLAFFSDAGPNLTDAEIVNYLLTGSPPGGGPESIDRSLSVGTYIGPKLFVEYETKLGEQSDRVKLRYDLNNWIELQSETGSAQGADIFFRFEN